MSTAAVLDTDVFSAVYIDPTGAARRGAPIESWLELLRGMQVLISFQTRAEVLAGVRGSNWGGHKVRAAEAKLGGAATIPADREVIESFATLTAGCRLAGHALHAKIHTGDRWVAAAAIAKGLPLLSNDRIFRGAPGLSLLG